MSPAVWQSESWLWPTLAARSERWGSRLTRLPRQSRVAPIVPAPPECVPSEEICRTPGFWGTHGGVEKGGPNITQFAIDQAGGSIEICGQTITNTTPTTTTPTAPGNDQSALEAICVSPFQEFDGLLFVSRVALRQTRVDQGLAEEAVGDRSRHPHAGILARLSEVVLPAAGGRRRGADHRDP